MFSEYKDDVQGQTMLAVDGQGICFSFGRKNESVALNSVNISVNRGSIYSLLGPSGCGKTTLLKCIVGQYKPQSGSLKTYGTSPGSKGFFIPGRGVGYMPQELALYMEMTIEEILTYFGSLFGMGMKHISDRIQFLVELLDLPDKKKLIQHLSGGQQRRVSFAIALIHKPPLLVLDEPTVGVDPLLRKDIWDHLVGLACKEHMTVIITTHYTEEARQAHAVGLMRKGQLLVERNPEDLIKGCQGFTLENVFLKVCQKSRFEDEEFETNIDELNTDRNLGPTYVSTNGTVSNEAENNETYTSKLKTDGGTFNRKNDLPDNTVGLLELAPLRTMTHEINFRAVNSWIRLLYLMRKNFLRMKRNIALMIFILAVSSLEIGVFYVCFSSDPYDLQVAVVNEETEGLNKYGERFLASINDHTIYQKPFQNLTLAYESLKQGESWAILHISSEFSTCLVDRVLESLNASNDTMECSTITLVLETSNYINSNTIRKTLWESYEAFALDVVISLGKNPSLGKIPFQIKEYSYDSKPAEFYEFCTPAVLICIAYITSIALTEMSLIAEKKNGLLSRALVAGATTTEVLLSFFFVLLVFMVLQEALMLIVTFCAFGVPCHGHIFWVIFAVMLAGICGMCFGLVISAATDDENIACLVAFGSFLPYIMISAAFWPFEAMPHYVRYISYCFPLTGLINRTRSVMLQGWNITEHNIWDGYLICSFWTVLQVVVSIILFKIRK